MKGSLKMNCSAIKILYMSDNCIAPVICNIKNRNYQGYVPGGANYESKGGTPITRVGPRSPG